MNNETKPLPEEDLKRLVQFFGLLIEMDLKEKGERTNKSLETDNKYRKDLIKTGGESKLFDYKGYKCETIFRNGYYCGYVFIDINSNVGKKIKDAETYNLTFKIHGDITYINTDEKWVIIGFDCNHRGDITGRYIGTREEKILKKLCNTITNISEDHEPNPTFKDEEFVKNELRGLVDQIIEMEHA